MNIRNLKYLVALADQGHFGRAAEACFVSQPALSMQIKKLEESLGVKLLERTNKSVLLTEIGIAIVERARQILNQVEEVREIAKSAKDPYSGELKIGIIPTLAPYLLPLIVPKLSKEYPKLSFYLMEEQTSYLIEKLKQGKLHAAFLSFPIAEKGLRSALLFEEEFLLATPNSYHLSKLKTVKPQDLDDQNLILLEEGHCMRNQALSFCEKMHAHENQNFRATSLETLRQMISVGIGVTLMPVLACSSSDSISYLSFSSPKPTRIIGLYWRTTSAKHSLLEEIATKIRMALKKQKLVKVIEK